MKRTSLEFIGSRFALVLLLFILLATAFTGTAFAETVISVSQQEPAAGGDENFTVNVYIEPDEPIAGVQFDFVFNSSLVSVENIREGDLLKQTGSDTVFIPGAIDNSNGIVTGIYGFILGKSAATTPGIFASIDLASTGGAGVRELQLSNVVVSDSSGHAVPVKVVNRTVRIENILTSPAEEPSGETQSEEQLTEEQLTEGRLTEEEIEPVGEVLAEETAEGNQEDRNDQSVFRGILSDIQNFFLDRFSI